MEDEGKWYVLGQVPVESDSPSASESEPYLGLPVAHLASNPSEEDSSQYKAAVSTESRAQKVNHTPIEPWPVRDFSGCYER